ncbi:hypothetical protein [Undibacter mobilis]|uniref:Uncharacterized protein n=1 Tax=Undibacter mobilis TaxID=2292256 RepID=A0A371B6M1_9BRAD|nr:hypothetical protein [Undibacter mobilis]RDV03245.1 hypothetical protein DXH78_00755 [Undibacter mobilis]
MRLTDIAEGAVSGLVARYVRRAILLALIGACVLVALYYVNSAASLALAAQYGPLYARLIMAGIYAVAGLIAFTVFYTTRNRALTQQGASSGATGLLSSPRNMQIAMLVEAVMLGYTLARKSGKGIL